MITNAGVAFLRSRIEAGSPLFTGTLYLALTADATDPAATDTTLAGELTANGLARAAVTVSHTTGANSWTFSDTFTYSGSSTQIVNKIALFDAASGGNMLTEDIVAASSFNISGDSTPFAVEFDL